eukprot:CAMPEP_0182518612 /NCGR_PEP_ID=MMETSP1321-20130603/44637_1 /TAXON_ID=91990 /ORGANISM="Bolidomonas sp., Strain RCC1657" /LENGTH=88 /DNA_ID=CAMNT_0024726547 /DNA_START=352 /DNA_END=619 /DNA_ORIENTATION=-
MTELSGVYAIAPDAHLLALQECNNLVIDERLDSIAVYSPILSLYRRTLSSTMRFTKPTSPPSQTLSQEVKAVRSRPSWRADSASAEFE